MVTSSLCGGNNEDTGYLSYPQDRGIHRTIEVYVQCMSAASLTTRRRLSEFLRCPGVESNFVHLGMERFVRVRCLQSDRQTKRKQDTEAGYPDKSWRKSLPVWPIMPRRWRICFGMRRLR